MVSQKIKCHHKYEDGSRCGRKKLAKNIDEDKRDNWMCHDHKKDHQHQKDNSAKSDDTGKNKLTDNQKEQIILWFAEGKQPTEISRLIKKEFEIEMQRQSVSYYKKKYQDKILVKQKELQKYISINIKLANKSSRVKELEDLYNEAMRQNKLDTARRVLKLIAEEMGELEENINITTTAKEGIMEAYERRKQRESNDQ